MSTKELRGKRSHFSSHRAKLYRTDETLLCEIKLNRTRDNGIIIINEIEYRVYNEFADRTWCLLKNDVETLCAVSPLNTKPCIIIEQKREDGQICARYRIRHSKDSLYEVHTYNDVSGDSSSLNPSPNDIKSSWTEQTSECYTTTTATSITNTINAQSHSTGIAAAALLELAQDQSDPSDNLIPNVQVLASRDFPTPKSFDQPGEPQLCALLDARHPRKYSVQLYSHIDDTPLCFLFFFFMVLRRKNSVNDSKSVSVTVADQFN